jgi:hypothetical protein
VISSKNIPIMPLPRRSKRRIVLAIGEETPDNVLRICDRRKTGRHRDRRMNGIGGIWRSFWTTQMTGICKYFFAHDGIVPLRNPVSIGRSGLRK